MGNRRLCRCFVCDALEARGCCFCCCYSCSCSCSCSSSSSSCCCCCCCCCCWRWRHVCPKTPPKHCQNTARTPPKHQTTFKPNSFYTRQLLHKSYQNVTNIWASKYLLHHDDISRDKDYESRAFIWIAMLGLVRTWRLEFFECKIGIGSEAKKCMLEIKIRF